MSTFGRYRLLERLGQGGMAEVFKAKSFGVEGFEKILVIKRILPELASRPGFAAMFIHEAKLAVRLSHANIVQVFDLGLSPGEEVNGVKGPDSYYMAMEYVHGLDLATVLSRSLRQKIQIPIPMAVFIASEVAKGLDHAHRRRDEQFRPLDIVHRDVSPHNVLLSYEGEVKVTDFGIAKAAGAWTTSSSSGGKEEGPALLHGKTGYMSPEQARDEDVDARSDLFSLGTILYECLAGVNPFSAPSSFETLRRVQAAEYPPVDLLREGTPPELLTIVKTAMAKTKEGRYADAGRMYEALLAFLYGHGGRFGAHELADFLNTCREPYEASVSLPISDRIFDADPPPAERTPALGLRPSIASKVAPSSARISVVERSELRGGEAGERRELSVVFIEPSHRGGPIGERTTEIIARYGGHLFREEPEQIVALFGLREPDGRDTETATRAALVIARGFEPDTAPSIGIHSGRVYLGMTETGDFEPLPDARLMSLIDEAQSAARTDPGRTIITASAARLIGQVFDLDQVLAHASSGTATTGLRAFAVKDVKGPAQAHGKFVGRKEELRRVGEVLATATKRQLRTLTVRGDHGIGKTRLLLEVERRLRKGGYNVGFHIATCPPRGAELPLSGVSAMLHILCGVADGDSHERILSVQPRLRALGLQEDEVLAVLAALGARVQGGPGNAGTVLRHAFGRMVGSLCEDRPHALAWDAAHCMDHESFSILEEVSETHSSARLVLAFAARAGFSHPLERRAGHLSLDLIDLSAADVERLIALRLGIDSAPDELVRFVRERAGGHPLFIEEVLKSLSGANAVMVTDRQLTTMRLVGQELALPKTLRGLVALRVSRLSPDERGALQAAAILGDPIDTNVLAVMRHEPLAILERSLRALAAQEFFIRTGPSEVRFASPIVPEVVVDALTPDSARALHDAAARALKAGATTLLGDSAVRIARHLYEAGDRKEAARYFAESGERRLEARQMEAATRDYGRAIALSEMGETDPALLTSWLTGFASAVRLVRAAPEAKELCSRVVSRVDEAGTPDLKVKARVAAGQLLSSVHCIDVARQYLTEAELAAEGDESLQKLVLIASAEMAARQGDFSRSKLLLERLEKLVTDDGDAAEKHKVAIHRSQAHAASGEREAALLLLERASALLPRDATAACERQKIRAFIDYFARDFEAATKGYERAAEMARAAGLTYEVMGALHNLGEIVFREKDFPRAYGTFQQSLALCDECGFERAGNFNRMFLAYLDGIADAIDGEKLLRQGIAYAQANDFSLDVLGGTELLAKLLLHNGKRDAARTEFEKARALAESTGNGLLLADTEAALRGLDGP